MAETLDLLGVIGTWAAALLAIIALAGIIPAYILYRESQTGRYEALSLVDDKHHEYLSKGYVLLPGKRFFRSITVPHFLEPPLAIEATNSRQVIVKRDCNLLDRDGSPSLTAWVNFANVLRAYGLSPQRDGKLKISGNEALLPVHRSWLLLLGLVDRYGDRHDSGLFIGEAADPDWTAFGSRGEALYGLSGIMERLHPGRDRICFRMHSVAHMRRMPEFFPAQDISPKNLLFLYLGYLPASDGSLYCSAVESDHESGPRIHRSTEQERDTFYKMTTLDLNDVPVRDRRLAEEMGIRWPKIRRLSLAKSIAERDREKHTVGTDPRTGLLDHVQYVKLAEGRRETIWLQPSEAQSMVLALLQLDSNSQSFICDDNLKEFFERLLPTKDIPEMFHIAEKGIDTLQIPDADKELVERDIGEVTNHQGTLAEGRGRSLALAKLDGSLQSLRQKYNAPERVMETIAILYLTRKNFRTIVVRLMAVDPRHIDPQAMFSVDIAQKRVGVPAIFDFPSVELDFDFAAVFGIIETEIGDNGRTLTLPLWQAMLAMLHASVKRQMWSAVFSARHLSAFHTHLKRIVYVSTQDLPDHEDDSGERLQNVAEALRRDLPEHKDDLGERLQDVANACREFSSLLRNANKNSSGRRWRRGVPFDLEKGESDDDDGDDEDDEDRHNESEDEGHGEREYEKNNNRGGEGSDYRSLPRPPQMRVRFAGVDTNQDCHTQDRNLGSEASPLLATPNLDISVDRDAPGHRPNNENDRNKGHNPAIEEWTVAGSMVLAGKHQEGRYRSGLEELLAAHPEIEEGVLTREFGEVIGPIVLMTEPLPVGSFARLLSISQATVLRQLNQLQSAMIDPILSVDPIELVNISFGAFITDPGLRGKHKFWVDEIKTHKTIATKCLELISQPGVLRENACSIKRPGQLRTDVSSETIEKALPAHVRYACRYWVYHFEKGECSISDDGQVTYFLKDHFLHWLEALSLMGCTNESITLVNILRSLVVTNSPQISLFLWEAWRFVLRNRDAIDETPLQLYSSAIIFLPKSSVIRSTFLQKVTRSICQLPEVNQCWDNVLLSLEGQSEGIASLAFSQDGKMLLSEARDGVIVWRPATGTLILKVQGVDGVTGAAFSPNCSQLAVVDVGGFASIYDLKTRTKIRSFETGRALSSVAFSKDGNLLAAGSSWSTITLWDVSKGVLVRRIEGCSEYVTALDFSSAGLLAQVSHTRGNQKVSIWRASSGKLLHTFEEFEEISGPLMTVVFIPKGSLLMASLDGTVKVWEPKDGAQVRTLISRDEHKHGEDGPIVGPMVLSPDGKQLAISCYITKTVGFYDPASGNKLSVVQWPRRSSPSCSPIALSPDGMVLAAAARRRDRIDIWELPGQTTPDWSNNSTTNVHLEHMMFAPNGKILATAGEKIASLWDSTTGKIIRTFEEFVWDINGLTFSPDSTMLAFISGPALRIWDLVGTNGVQNINIGDRNAGPLSFSPDGKTIAVGSLQKILLCDAVARSVQNTFSVLDQVRSIAFSTDGNLLASGLYNGMIQRWSLTTGTPLSTLSGHTEEVQDLSSLYQQPKEIVRVAFTSNSKMLASASADSTITLWDWVAGTNLQTFHAGADITDLHFSDNDRHLETNLDVFALEESAKRKPFKILSSAKFGLRGDWVTRNRENFLWLPFDYRNEPRWSYHDSSVQIFGSRGNSVALLLDTRVVFLGFDNQTA